MSTQTRDHDVKEVADRIYNKVLERIHDDIEKDMADIKGDIKSRMKQIDERVEKVRDNIKMDTDGIKSRIKQIDKRVEKMESSTGVKANTNNSTSTWFCIGSGVVSTNPPPENDPSVFQLSQDLYAILATSSWRSLPFWLSNLVIFGFQYLLVILLLENQVDVSADKNKLNLPPNVELPVRISQAMLIIIVFFSQRDMLDGIESLVRGMPDHFCGDSRFASMTKLQWRFSSIVRLIQGLLTFLASYVLAVRSETVPDVLLNVLGVAFISDLDDLAFRLCTKGYFGGSMKTMSTDVCDVRFHWHVNTRTSISISKKLKKDAHIVNAFAFVVAGLVAFSILAIRQNNGEYIEHDIRVEFGDEVLPFLGLFNGCYRKSESNNQISRRLVYEQVGYPNGGKFGFCSEFGEGDSGWTFFIGEHGEDDCKQKGYILRSSDTSTFSLLEAGKTKWYTYDDLPMEYLEITENKASTTNCGHSMFSSSKDACPSILAFDTMNLAKLSPSLVNVDESSQTGLDASTSHPIYYYSKNGENGSFTLIFFTGRRWITAESDHIQGLGNETSEKGIGDFFFSHGGLFKLVDQLRNSMDKDADWFSAVSEIVDTTRDQGSPLGLLWYLPRYDETSDDGSEKATLRRNFPSANLARPIDSEWKCLFCNSETNPCLNQGICGANGTCFCRDGWAGELCQEPPTGDGTCNLYFNTEKYHYDGGDCCAGTCRGEDCGKDDLPDPFLGIIPEENNGSFFDRPFLNATEDWKKTFLGHEYAYGVDIEENLVLHTLTSGRVRAPRRFSHCIDPDTAIVRIEQKPRRMSNEGIWLTETTLRCGLSMYLHTPQFMTTNIRPNHPFKEEVRVPYGARCAIGFMADATDPSEFSIFAENQTVPFLQQEFSGFDSKEVIRFRIPESECVWNVLVENNISPIFDDLEYEEFVGGVDLNSMCDQDPGEVLDRYAIWKILKSSGTDGDLSQKFNGHLCDFTWNTTGSIVKQLQCPGSRRVNQLDLGDAEFSSEIGILTALEHLEIYGDSNNNLGSSLPSEIGRLTSLKILVTDELQLASIPSEIGNLASLTDLYLSGSGDLSSIPSEIGNLASLKLLFLINNNNLKSIPSEIGKMTSLATLPLQNNKLTSIPSEVGNLASLVWLHLNGNKLTSIPSEIGNLTSLKSLNLPFNPIIWDSLPIQVRNSIPSIWVCRAYGDSTGCLDHLCNNTAWEVMGYTCDDLSASGTCYPDYLDSVLNRGRQAACCICGGGQKYFPLD